MKLRLGTKLLLAVVACSAAVTAQAATVWNEGNNGDLSDDWLSPTALVLASGANTVVGSVSGSSGGQEIDRDYFSFTVPAGTTLTSLTVLSDTSVSGGSSFLGLQIGPQFTVGPTEAGPADLFSFLHFSGEHVGQDILPLLDGPFIGGLPSGVYTAWVQETAAGASYGFDFGVSAVPVPLPGAALLLFSGLLGVGTLRRRGRLSSF